MYDFGFVTFCLIRKGLFMKKNYLAGVVALLCAPVLAYAADPVVTPGKGAEYIAKITFDKDTLKNGGAEKVIKTGDVLVEPHTSTTVAAVKSMGWNDNAVNPKACSATVTSGCITALTAADLSDKAYGWSHNSHWYLVDLTALKGKTAHIHIKLERMDDGTATETGSKTTTTSPVTNADGSKTTTTTTTTINLPSDDDLIPGLTVFKGAQLAGTKIHWYPNRHQGSLSDDKTVTIPFWGSNLQKPTWRKTAKTNYELKGENSGALGYDTANGAGDQNVAEVSGEIKLDASNMANNYLTIALAGDARHASSADKHDVNYQLTVAVHSH